MSTTPKKIDQELKARAGEYESLTAAAAVVTRQLGVGKESMRRWVLQAQVDDGQLPRTRGASPWYRCGSRNGVTRSPPRPTPPTRPCRA
jgi:transposase-like protein